MVDIIIDNLALIMFGTMFFVIFCGYPVAYVMGGMAMIFACIGWYFGVFPMIGLSNVVLRMEDIAIFAITIPLMVGLALFVKRTRLGRGMRATAQNPIAARLMGIDTDRVIAATFMIGGFLGGAASVMWSVYNNTISFQMGFRAGMDAFTAAVLGGIGSLPGAMVGGVLIGLIRAMSDQYIETRWTNVVVFSVLVLILVFRPSGILGLKQREKV